MSYVLRAEIVFEINAFAFSVIFHTKMVHNPGRLMKATAVVFISLSGVVQVVDVTPHGRQGPIYMYLIQAVI